MAKKTAKVKIEKEKDLDIFQSGVVPKHELVNPEERSDLLKRLNIKPKQLPRIKRNDIAARVLNAKKGDIIRIIRRSPVAGEYYYYRVVA